jgi:hypothetical protein
MIGTQKPKNSENNLLQCQFVHQQNPHEPTRVWTRAWAETIIHLSYGTVVGQVNSLPWLAVKWSLTDAYEYPKRKSQTQSPHERKAYKILVRKLKGKKQPESLGAYGTHTSIKYNALLLNAWYWSSQSHVKIMGTNHL